MEFDLAAEIALLEGVEIQIRSNQVLDLTKLSKDLV